MHDEQAHFLLSPADLAHHIEKDHGVVASSISIEPRKVTAYFKRQGIESTGNVREDELLMWHERAHHWSEGQQRRHEKE